MRGSPYRYRTPPAQKKRPKNLKKEVVLERVREKILAMKADFEVASHHPYFFPSIRAEAVAVELDVGLGKVRWAFHKLNVEGLISQAHLSSRGKYYVVNCERTEENRRSAFDDAWPEKPKGAEMCLAICDEKPFNGKMRYSKRLQRRMG